MKRFRYALFLAGGMATLLISLALFGYIVIGEDDQPNALALVTLIGAPFAYWLAWVMPFSRVARVISVVTFAACVGPAMFGWIVFAYLPSFACLVAGAPVLHEETEAP